MNGGNKEQNVIKSMFAPNTLTMSYNTAPVMGVDGKDVAMLYPHGYQS